MNDLILQACIMFIVRQIVKFGASINWDTVKSDFSVRIKALFHSDFLSEELIALGDSLIDGAAAVLKDADDLQKIADLAAKKDWGGAAQAVKDMIMGIWQPTSPEGVALVSALGQVNVKVS